IGLLWIVFVSYVLINAADQRGKRLLIQQTANSFSSSRNYFGGGVIVLGGASGTSGSSGCEHYSEYKDLIRLENDLQCHSVDTVFTKLRALHERTLLHGTNCMRDAIQKLSIYFSTYHDHFKGCKCTGFLFVHPERYHN
ncbi:hypothetical protein ACJMK2_013410, partial [Sinanodonta woodiana]